MIYGEWSFGHPAPRAPRPSANIVRALDAAHTSVAAVLRIASLNEGRGVALGLHVADAHAHAQQARRRLEGERLGGERQPDYY